MKADDHQLLAFLNGTKTFIVPIYQRTYSWDKKQCQQLWDDIIRAGSKEHSSPHFIGSIVYVQEGTATVNSHPWQIIDGQQRLTTMTLLLEALAQSISDSEAATLISAAQIRDDYLHNKYGKGDKAHKVVLSKSDKETLSSILDGRPYPKNRSNRIVQNFEYFLEKFAKDKGDLEIIWRGINQLFIVGVSLERDEDNPQLIFESLNSTGKALSQADLIRNFILMGLTQEEQIRFYEHYWHPMEDSFGQEGYDEYFDDFVKHYLTLKTGDIPRENEVYIRFKEFINDSKQDDFEQTIKEIKTYSQYFCAIALGQETHLKLNKLFADIKELKVNVALPLILNSYSKYARKVIDEDQFAEIIKLIESYVFRRAICEIPTNSMNMTFAGIASKLQKADISDGEAYMEFLKAQFLLLQSKQRMPDDEEFTQSCKTRNIYKFPRKLYMLDRIENFDSKERAQIENYSVEHIMPQNPNLPKEWQIDLGDNWKQIQETYLHTLGNLTLTGYNSEYKDHPFKQKKNMSKGFAESPLTLNRSVARADTWNENAINKRADELTTIAVKIWKRPALDRDVLDKYKPAKKKVKEYSISDHKYLVNSNKTIGLFEALEKEVLSLNSDVYRVVTSLYVAYKLNTNFVDVIPKAKSLRLAINLDFENLYDPQDKCEDVSGKGRWGNGEVSLEIKNQQDIPYALTIIRQALDDQL